MPLRERTQRTPTKTELAEKTSIKIKLGEETPIETGFGDEPQTKTKLTEVAITTIIHGEKATLERAIIRSLPYYCFV